MRIKILVTFVLVCFCFYQLQAQTSVPKHRPRVGLVLSGGGAKGMAHIGVLKVLEEAGVPIDYIGGTSMGSIVGGLYAIGYSPAFLDSVVRVLNWEELLTDKISRRNLSMIEKDEDVKYLFSFPIREKKISLPSAIVSGQCISSLLSELSAPVYNIDDFSKFHIPFLCVATDIERGKAVVLRHGNFAEAVRASMAIPTVFTPEIIDGQVLLDGGLINNFPVQEVRNMGADIIIGVDVGFRFYKGPELNSMLKIIEQSIFMHSIETNKHNRDSCNILIVPKLSEYNASSFGKADSLIKRGETAARRQMGRLRELATYLHSFDDSTIIRPQPIKKVDTLCVKEIEIVGLKDIPEDFVLRRLSFDASDTITIDDLNNDMNLIYGTRFFERVNYSFTPRDGGVKVTIKVVEKNTNFFRVGLHYDSDFKTTLLLNTTFRNMLYRGSKISLDLALGDNPSIGALLYKNTGWNPKYYSLLRSRLVPDFGLRMQAKSTEVYQYEGRHRVASYNFGDITSDLFLQANLSNSNIVRVGFVGDFSSISDRINSTNSGRVNSFHANFYTSYRKDSYDEAYYPSRGSKVFLEGKFVKGLSDDVRSNAGFLVATLRSDFIVPISRRLSILGGVSGGTVVGDSIPVHYLFYLGGQGTLALRGLMPFVGMDFMQQACHNLLITSMHVQWEMWNDNFLILKANAAKAENDRKEMIIPDNIALGYGAAFGYRSPIGPMEFNVMTSNRNQLLWFVNIGYCF